MKIAVIGAGAIGCVVAFYLKKSGEDVVLIGHKGQVEAINHNGLTVRGIRGNETLAVKAAEKLTEEQDLAIFTTKTQDLEDAYQANAEFLENGLILTSQNGVQADNILGVHFEQPRMFSSIVMFGATYIKPAEVIFNFEGDWIIGRPYMSIDQKTHDIAEVLKKAFSVEVSPNIMGMKYLKLFVNFNNCIPAVIGKSMQETFSDIDLCKLSVLLLKEGIDVIQKAKIELVSLPHFPVERIHGLINMPLDQAAGIIHKTLTGLSKEPLYGSILQSIMRGRESEIDFINGEVVSIGKQLHAKTPLNEKMVDLVHKIEQTGKFYNIEDIKNIFKLGDAGAIPASPAGGHESPVRN